MYAEEQQYQVEFQEGFVSNCELLYSPTLNKIKNKCINRFENVQQQKYSEEKCSILTILNSLKDDNLHQKTFKICWDTLISKVNPYVKFSNYMPVPVSQQGAELISNSQFIIHWLQVMKMCPFVCFSIILRHTARSHKKCFQNSQQLQSIWNSIYGNQQFPTKNRNQKTVAQIRYLKRNIQEYQNSFPPQVYKKQQKYQNRYDEVTSSQIGTQLF